MSVWIRGEERGERKRREEKEEIKKKREGGRGKGEGNNEEERKEEEKGGQIRASCRGYIVKYTRLITSISGPVYAARNETKGNGKEEEKGKKKSSLGANARGGGERSLTGPSVLVSIFSGL